MSAKHFHTRLLVTAAMAALTTFQGGSAQAASLNLTDSPLFLNQSVPPLNMLVMGRDHKLYYEAYNDASDLNDDGVLDVGYQPTKIDYFGYFDSFKCYTHNGSQFVPARISTTKICGGSGEWSGDWLNYVTTARIDALRKVLYGGKRSTPDTAAQTVLERTLVPQDAHSWGKEYTSLAVDGYNIRDYTPYALPLVGTRHLFANTTLMLTTDWTLNTDVPRLRVLLDRPERIWHWVSKESPVAGGDVNPGTGLVSVTPTDLTVRVQVCVPGLLETNCKRYPSGNYKPTGLLQDFGETDRMLFGLLSGSYTKSKSGGVLRKDIGTLSDEINVTTDGTLKPLLGIIHTMDQMRVAGYTNYTGATGTGAGVVYPPGLVTTRPINEGEFGGMWGNPVGEMMYEALRYFAGKGSPTPAYNYGSGIDSTVPLSLNKVDSWQNPYGASRPSCAKPFETVLSDVNVSYDTDQLPGSAFGSFSGDLPGLNVSTLADEIWNNEIGSPGKYYIGQSATSYDGAPTPKTVTSFSNIRGLAPEEPTKEGGYYAASVAHFGHKTDINVAKSGDQKVQTFAVALASPLPRIEIPAASGKITLLPFAKSVGGCAGVNGTPGVFQPTNQIVDFYVESIGPTSGSFQVNFEDVEAGNDHDMDAIVRYAYVVNADNTVTVTLSSDYAAGCIIQHMGYVISGTTEDGIYLEVRDRDTASGSDPDYFLDTPPGQLPVALGGTYAQPGALPLLATRTFTPGTSPGATILKDPLWYAAKWGGFKDQDNNDLPNITSEWDEDGDGEPDNYFLVTNALKLGTQLTKAFDEILARVASASSASVNSGSISSETRVYQARFNSGTWSGELLSFPVRSDGTLGAMEWNAAEQLPAADSRAIITRNSVGTAVPFRWANLDDPRRVQIDPNYPMAPTNVGPDRLNYLRGDSTKEVQNGGTLRNRPVSPFPNKLGDIVDSAPAFVGAPPFRYSDTLETKPYSVFRDTYETRRKMVYAGANDGMLHGFDAVTGQEVLAYVPSDAYGNATGAGGLRLLTDPAYSHRYFVDGSPTTGDAFFANNWHTMLVGGMNKGGQGIYALEITNPANFSEANAANIVRWEYKNADLGYTFSRPAIVRMRNGKWAAVFGNGYNNTLADGTPSTTGRAYLFIVDIETGVLIRKIDTLVGSTTTPNGLATPAAVDTNGDSVVDYIYAGDLLGNMWKFNVTNATPANWNSAYLSGTTPVPLFQARDALNNPQPITSRPEVSRGPNGVGMVVLFGTGKYLEAADKDIATLKTQSFYGIIDKNTGTLATDTVTGRTVLTQQTIQVEQSFNIGGKDWNLRFTSQNALVAPTDRGWYMDLVSPVNGFEGEMQVSDSILRNGRIVFTTLIPSNDPCEFGGTSWLMEMDAISGARLQLTPFDLNRDGLFNDDDMVEVTIGGSLVKIPASGLESEVGITPKPGVLAGENAEYKYTPGTTGNIQVTVENPGANAVGRQSWRQTR